MSDDPPEPSRPSPEHLDLLLRSLLELPAADRDRWIEASSAGNSELRDQLREMIRRAQTASIPPFRVEAPISAGTNPDAPGASGPMPAAGERLGRYEVIDLLGAGGMGSVYRALDGS